MSEEEMAEWMQDLYGAGAGGFAEGDIDDIFGSLGNLLR